MMSQNSINLQGSFQLNDKPEYLSKILPNESNIIFYQFSS